MTDKKALFFDFLYVTVGVFLLAFGITIFYEHHSLVTGGFSGVSIIVRALSLKYLSFEIPLWFTNLSLNIPLFLITIKLKGFYFLTRTIYATFLFSFFLYIIAMIPPVETDLFLASIYGGVFSGIGLGLSFRGLATTGGTDLLATIINTFKPHLSVSKLVFYLDAGIVAIGVFVFGFEKAMYAIIGVFISSKCIENVLEGLNFSKAVFIISERTEDIAADILNSIDRGVTGLSGTGMYTLKSTTVLLTVVSVKEITALKTLVNKIDKNSFVIVADVREVLGEGFKSFG